MQRALRNRPLLKSHRPADALLELRDLEITRKAEASLHGLPDTIRTIGGGVVLKEDAVHAA
jgi:hypothetical protein